MDHANGRMLTSESVSADGLLGCDKAALPTRFRSQSFPVFNELTETLSTEVGKDFGERLVANRTICDTYRVNH